MIQRIAKGVGKTLLEIHDRVWRFWHDDDGWYDLNGKRVVVSREAVAVGDETDHPAGTFVLTADDGKDKIFVSDGERLGVYRGNAGVAEYTNTDDNQVITNAMDGMLFVANGDGWVTFQLDPDNLVPGWEGTFVLQGGSVSIWVGDNDYRIRGKFVGYDGGDATNRGLDTVAIGSETQCSSVTLRFTGEYFQMLGPTGDWFDND